MPVTGARTVPGSIASWQPALSSPRATSTPFSRITYSLGRICRLSRMWTGGTMKHHIDARRTILRVERRIEANTNPFRRCSEAINLQGPAIDASHREKLARLLVDDALERQQIAMRLSGDAACRLESEVAADAVVPRARRDPVVAQLDRLRRGHRAVSDTHR